MPKNTIKFEIVTPERIVLKEDILQVSVPTKQGEITVLPKHIPLVAALMPGVIELVKSNNDKVVMSVSGGFIEVSKAKVVILADTAERAEEINLEKAEESRKKAEELMKDVRRFDAERFAGINAQIAKELARTKAAKRWKRLKNIN